MTRYTTWDGSRVGGQLAAIAIAAFSVVAPAAAQVPNQPAIVAPYTLTPKRMLASSSALVGLIGSVIGGLAMVRSRGRVGPGQGRRGARVALVMGPIAMAVGGLVVITANGGLGTGNGIAGGVVAIALGLTATSLGSVVVARARRVT